MLHCMPRYIEYILSILWLLYIQCHGFEAGEWKRKLILIQESHQPFPSCTQAKQYFCCIQVRIVWSLEYSRVLPGNAHACSCDQKFEGMLSHLRWLCNDLSHHALLITIMITLAVYKNDTNDTHFVESRLSKWSLFPIRVSKSSLWVGILILDMYLPIHRWDSTGMLKKLLRQSSYAKSQALRTAMSAITSIITPCSVSNCRPLWLTMSALIYMHSHKNELCKFWSSSSGRGRQKSFQPLAQANQDYLK